MSELDDILGTPKPQSESNLFGQVTPKQQAEIEAEAKAVPASQHFTNSLLATRDHAAAAVARVFTEDDPEYNQAKNAEYYLQGLDDKYMDNFVGVLGPKSHVEAQMIRDQIITDETNALLAQNAGFKGQASSLLGSLLDPSTLPLALASGGTYTGTKVAAALSKTSLAGTRRAGALSVGSAGLEAGIYTGLLESAVRPSVGAEEIPEIVLMSGAFAGTLGGATKYNYGMINGAKATREELSDVASSLDEAATNGVTTVKASKIGRLTREYLSDESGSLNMEALFPKKDKPDVDADPRDSLDASDVKDYDYYADMYDDLDLGNTYKYDDSKSGRAAQRFQSVVDKSEVITSNSARMSSWGTVGSVLSYKLFTHPAAIGRNAKPADRLTSTTYNNLMGEMANKEKWRRLQDAWGAEQGRTPVQRNLTQRSEVRNAFSREVALARAAKYYDGEYPENLSAPVKETAEMLDRLYERALKEAQRAEVKGFETLETKAGWSQQKWNADTVGRFINETNGVGKRNRKALTDTLVSQYVRGGIPKDLAQQYADALVRRQSAKAKHLDMNVYNLLNQEGEAFLKQALVDNGFTEAKADKFIKALKGLDADRGKISTAKSRIDIDPRAEVGDTGKILLDFLEHDVYRSPAMYSRQIAGAVGLARNGLNYDDLPRIKDLIKAEVAARGGEMNLFDQELLDNFESYFRSGPISGGEAKWVGRVTRLTNLAVLNQLGLTQLAETGTIVGAVGISHFKDAVIDTLRKADKETLSMLSQFEDIGLYIGQNHNLLDVEASLDYVRQSPNTMTGAAAFLDRTLAAGTRFQGKLSGFYTIMGLQHSLAVNGINRRMYDVFKNGVNQKDLDRLADIGLEGDSLKRIQKYFTDGTVVPEDGTLNFNFDKWDFDDIDTFKNSMYAFADQVVQRGLAGEESIWWNNGYGRLLTHLRTFNLTAMSKSFARNLRHGDSVAAATLSYGLMTAALSYMAKQILNGKEENLEPEKIAKSAFGYSNMTGWMPMFYDPAMAMMGLHDFRINNYRHDISSDIIPTPPSVDIASRMLHIPEAVASIGTGNMTKQDVYALQATPLIGNLYGMARFWDMAKDEAANQARERREARKQETDAESQAKQILGTE